MPAPLEITPSDLKSRLDQGEKIFLLDCREAFEFQVAHIPGADLYPMRGIPSNLQQIEAKADEMPVVVYCHHGMRSLQVTQWLREQGVENCRSLAGGIDRWSREIDPAVARY